MVDLLLGAAGFVLLTVALGLVRIRCEAKMSLEHERIGDRIRLIAIRALEDT